MLPQNISGANSIVCNVCIVQILQVKDPEEVEDSELDNEVCLLPD